MNDFQHSVISIIVIISIIQYFVLFMTIVSYDLEDINIKTKRDFILWCIPLYIVVQAVVLLIWVIKSMIRGMIKSYKSLE